MSLSISVQFLSLLVVVLLVLSAVSVEAVDKFDNINGYYAVYKGWHYSNKTSVTWGQNSQKDWSVVATLPIAAATYDCTNTTSYSCEDPIYMYDWNKLWGKARCGYTHDHHEDSDRFVFRKCSDPTCDGYLEGQQRIQIGAYSYDGGVAPYTGQNPELMKTFKTTVSPNVAYRYRMIMDSTGLSTFMLYGSDETLLETVTVQHTVTCSENYNEGTVDGLYFGGTCAAPEEIVVLYQAK
jgi:hypothetical protein